jgi:hypothetical protein
MMESQAIAKSRDRTRGRGDHEIEFHEGEFVLLVSKGLRCGRIGGSIMTTSQCRVPSRGKGYDLQVAELLIEDGMRNPTCLIW